MGVRGSRAHRLLIAVTVTAAACCAVLGLTGTAPAPTASAATASVGTKLPIPGVWGAAHSLLGIAAVGGKAWPSTLDCTGPGDCLTAGNNSLGVPGAGPPGTSVLPGSLAEEKRGVWARSIPVPGLAALSRNQVVQVNAVGCGSPGNCAIGGFYGERIGDGSAWDGSAFLDTERNGKWGIAKDAPGTDALNRGSLAEITSLACTAKGDCTAGGFYNVVQLHSGPPVQNGFIIDERNGVWSTARPVPGLAVHNTTAADSVAAVSAVSCASPGNCVAAGSYTPNAWGGSTGTAEAADQAFIAEEKNGTWHAARLIAAMSEITLISCPAVGDCVASGEGFTPACATGYDCPAAYVTEKNGSWGAPRGVLSARQEQTHIASITALSCGQRGDCVAGGSIAKYSAASGLYDKQAFLLAEKDGAWSSYREVPGTAALNTGGDATVTSVSCTAAGNCTLGGLYTNRKATQLGFLLTETGFTWSRLTTIGFGPVGVVSCFSPSSCAALVGAETAAGAGSFNITDYGGVMEKELVQATRTVLKLSATRVRYGHEQAVRAWVTVTAGLGDPSGTVVVESGTTTICVIGLVSGSGRCTLKPKILGTGTHVLTAYYLGLPQFRASASATRTLKVTR